MPRLRARRESGRKPNRTFTRGMKSIPASMLNILNDFSRELIGANRPQQPRPHGKQGGSRRLIFLEENQDYIICTTPTGYAGGSPYSPQINVAKPYLLRYTPFDGSSRNSISYSYNTNNEREADTGSEVIIEVITPSYVLGDHIIAGKVGNGTGVTDTTYLDLNNDSRTWAEIDEADAQGSE